MGRSAKWIKDVHPSQPVSEVARMALAFRLDAVAYYLPKAATSAEDDIEYVHQLRVATRRSMAALQTFQSLLPARRARKLRKMLGRLRRAAGAARDLDVLYERLCEHAEQTSVPGMKKVLAKVIERREESQCPLLEAHRRWKKKNCEKWVSQLLARVRWRSENPEPSFEQSAAQALCAPVSEFFQAARADLDDIVALHRMRICAKQLRYTMELLAGAFASDFRERLYPTFTEVQEKLGAINDCATAKRLFENWAAAAKSGDAAVELNRMAGGELQQLDSVCGEFRQWWTSGRAGRLRKQFEPYLVHLDPSATQANDRSDLPRATAL